jgi:hypothetical protein
MKIEYQPKGQKVCEVDEQFIATDKESGLEFFIYRDKVRLRGWDGVGAHYTEFGFYSKRDSLTLDLLRKFIKAYDDTKEGK